MLSSGRDAFKCILLLPFLVPEVVFKPQITVAYDNLQKEVIQFIDINDKLFSLRQIFRQVSIHISFSTLNRSKKWWSLSAYLVCHLYYFTFTDTFDLFHLIGHRTPLWPLPQGSHRFSRERSALQRKAPQYRHGRHQGILLFSSFL